MSVATQNDTQNCSGREPKKGALQTLHLFGMHASYSCQASRGCPCQSFGSLVGGTVLWRLSVKGRYEHLSCSRRLNGSSDDLRGAQVPPVEFLISSAIRSQR